MFSSFAEVALVAAALSVLAYPAAYWSFVRVRTPMLFTAASYGLPMFVGLLALGLFIPFQVFGIYLAPELEAGGYLQLITPVVSALEAVFEYCWLVLFALYLASPPLLKKRYAQPRAKDKPRET